MREPHAADMEEKEEAEYHLTEAVDFYINGHLAALAAEADEALNMQDSAEKLIAFLQDASTLCTVGFVLRRQLRAQGVLSPEVAEEPMDANCPWPMEETQRVARLLHKEGLRRHGLEIPVKNWIKYLNDDLIQGLQRQMVFKLAFVTNMDHDATLRLLLACQQDGYNPRDPLELICYYCQCRPGVYSWWQVEDLLRKFQQGDGQEGRPAQATPPSLGKTRLLRGGVEDLLRGTLPQAEADRELLRWMDQCRKEFAGYSLTGRAKYLHLTRYLHPLYPTFWMKDQRTYEEKEKAVQTDGEGFPVLKQQLTAALQAHFGILDHIGQTDAGARQVYTDQSGERVAFSAALGQIALFCKHYYYRANEIDRGVKPVDRRDVLLLGYFLLGGAVRTGREGWAALAEIAGKDRVLGTAVGALLPDLRALGHTQDIQERSLLIRRVLNELLAAFGFAPPLYTPAAFDRFVFLCALKDTEPVI